MEAQQNPESPDRDAAAPRISPLAGLPPEVLETARGRLADRGFDPARVVGKGDLGNDITLTGFYVMLGMVAATEKAGQNPTFAMARLALQAGLPSEIADTLFLAYNQQSAEEAGHGDKVFANAYYLMGGFAPAAEASVVGNAQGSGFLAPDPDPKTNKQRLCGVAAVLGGIETVALNRAFPTIVSICERWDHPIARDLHAQIRDVVRPEEARHVLNWRYVFHHMIAPKGDGVVQAYFAATNQGRATLGSPALDFETFTRMQGTSAPTLRQLLGKDRVAFN
jgi:hypothetical protein